LLTTPSRPRSSAARSSARASSNGSEKCRQREADGRQRLANCRDVIAGILEWLDLSRVALIADQQAKALFGLCNG
jgi:hypothetical protein